MQCFTELAAPSAVAHSLSLPFILADEVNLVVAKTSLLQIFRTVSISVDVDTSKVESPTATRNNAITDRRANDEEGFESSFLVADAQLQRAERATSTKLVLVAEYALAGTITSMVRVNTAQSKSGGESILLGFKDAKLSLVEWDPQRHSLSTTSIHYYEQEDLEASPWAPKLGDCVNYLTVDPGSRCAALKFGLRNLAILPFKQSDNDVAMDEDWDEDLDGPRPQQNGDTQMTNGDANHVDTPYTSSFVLGLPTLDPALLHPIDIAFLYEYRDPTFGILSSKQYSCSSLLPERRDQVSYMVFTLDLHQRASTTILAVNNLPYDLFMIVPLPPPVGGALLVGYNEIIHVDQSGKTNGVAVNPFTKRCTSFALADQSDMELRLEGCKVEKLSDDGDMLIITRNAELIILSFRMDGRSVSGLNLRRVPDSILTARPSCTTILSDNRMFVGSEVGDSVLLGWSKKSGALQRRRSSAAMEGVISPDIDDDEEDGADDDDFDEDDLYGDEDTTTQVRNGVTKTTNGTDSKTGDYTFRLHDSQLSLGPIRDITLSRPFRPPPSSEDETADKADDTIQSELEIVLATGKDKSGALAILKEEIEPKAIGRFDFSEARGVWTLSAKKPVSKALQPDNNKNKETLEGQSGVEAEFDRLMIVSKAVDGQPEESAVYALTGVGFEALQGTEFEPAAGGSLEAGTLGNGMRIIQVLRSEVRSYDGGESSFLYPYGFATHLEECFLCGCTRRGATNKPVAIPSNIMYTAVADTSICSIASMESICPTARSIFALCLAWSPT
jgi:cleavage and polyadenylation specificity factor subunit 1